MPKTSALQPQRGSNTRGRIEVLPNAIHSIAVQAVYNCYGVLGMASSRLRNGHAILLTPEQSNQGVHTRILNDELIIDVYVALEYGLRISEIANTIMRHVKFSVENVLGIPVAQVNVNVQGLIHGPTSLDKNKKNEKN